MTEWHLRELIAGFKENCGTGLLFWAGMGLIAYGFLVFWSVLLMPLITRVLEFFGADAAGVYMIFLGGCFVYGLGLSCLWDLRNRIDLKLEEESTAPSKFISWLHTWL